MTSYNETVAIVSRNIRKKYVPKRIRPDTPRPVKRIRPTLLERDIVPNLPITPVNSPCGPYWFRGPNGLQPVDHILNEAVLKTAPRRKLRGVFDAVENLDDLFEAHHLY